MKAHWQGYKPLGHKTRLGYFDLIKMVWLCHASFVPKPLYNTLLSNKYSHISQNLKSTMVYSAGLSQFLVAVLLHFGFVYI